MDGQVRPQLEGEGDGVEELDLAVVAGEAQRAPPVELLRVAVPCKPERAA